MAGDDVSPDEMQRFSSSRDPIDAVLNGDSLDKDLLEVAVLVHDVRAAYLSENPLRRRPELVAYTGPTAATEMHLDASGPPGHAVASAPPASAACPDGPPSVAKDSRAKSAGRKRAASGLLAFAGTLGGKVVAGGVAVAATVGMLHTAGAVHLPIPPGGGQSPAEQPDDGTAGNGDQQGPSGAGGGGQPQTGEPSGQGQPGEGGRQGPEQSTRTAPQDEAHAYTEAVDEWTDCVADAAAARSDADARATGGFDPRETCGEKPEPSDFGLDEAPSATPGSGAGNQGDGSTGEGRRDQTPVPDTVPPGSGDPDPPGQGSDPRGAGSGNANRGGTPAQDTPGGTAPGRPDSGGSRPPAGPPSS